MGNQERNREALIDHIAEQDRIIRRRNEQIAQQAENARQAQNTIEENEAQIGRLRATLATTARQRDGADRNDQTRPLTADDATDAQIAAAYRAGRFALADWLAGRTDRTAEEMNR